MNKSKITWHTRCPECKTTIDLTDWDDGDIVLVRHRHHRHGVVLPEWAEYPESE